MAARGKAHPVVGLESAVDRARQIREAYGKRRIALAVLAKCWGLSASGGLFRRLISALKQFGLADDQGSRGHREVFLSELGLAVLSPIEDGRMRALQEAALKPSIYHQLWSRADQTMPSDSEIEDFCIRIAGYGPASAKIFIRNFKSTVSYSGLAEGAILGDEDDEDGDEDSEEKEPSVHDEDNPPSPEPSPPPSPKKPGMDVANKQHAEEIRVPFYLSTGIAHLTMPTPISPGDFDSLKDAIESALEGLKAALVRDTPPPDHPGAGPAEQQT